MLSGISSLLVACLTPEYVRSTTFDWLAGRLTVQCVRAESAVRRRCSRLRPPAAGGLASALWLVKLSANASVCDMFGQSIRSQDSWPARGQRAAPSTRPMRVTLLVLIESVLRFVVSLNCDAREMLFSALFCCDEMVLCCDAVVRELRCIRLRAVCCFFFI